MGVHLLISSALPTIRSRWPGLISPALRIKPLVEVGFMPEALSTNPAPYRHSFPEGSIFTGWAYPPKDYQKWADVVFHFASHLRDRYGDAETKTWLWEIWNEPDIDYWKGTPEEFFKLYDFSAAAILRALPGASIGGPDTTGPASPKAAEFLRKFLEHSAHERNFATGKTGSPLSFISFHPKGSPEWRADHVQMGIARQLASIEQGFKIAASFPEWRQIPIILGESDPEGCAACSAPRRWCAERASPSSSRAAGPSGRSCPAPPPTSRTARPIAASTTCATPRRRSCSRRGCRTRSRARASGTARSASPGISTATSCPAWSGMPPRGLPRRWITGRWAHRAVGREGTLTGVAPVRSRERGVGPPATKVKPADRLSTRQAARVAGWHLESHCYMKCYMEGD